MENSGFLTTALPVALAIIMLGLGLGLSIDDFKRVGKNPRAVLIALGIQLILLPAIALALIYLIGLQGALAVGVILLAASPGGTTANLFSHLFRGDVALNVSLTAINSVIAVVTLPLFTNFALGLFLWIPGVIWVAEKIYMWVSRNRHLLSKVFGCKGACAILPERKRDGEEKL